MDHHVEDHDLMEDETDVVTPSLTFKELSKGPAIGLRWGVGHTLHMFSTKRGDRSVYEQKNPKGSGEIITLQWERASASMRKLMCESHGLFMQVQSLDEYAARANPHALHQELVLCSRKYRAVLRAVYQHTAHLLQDPALPHRREVKLMVETQRLAEQVWHLCEIFFLLPEMQAQPLLADWIQSHFPITDDENETDEMLLQRILGVPRPEESERYWDYMFQFALRGLSDVVVYMLERHSLHPRRIEQRAVSRTGELLHILTSLVREMPQLKNCDTIADFQAKWRQWQVNIRHFAQSHVSTLEDPRLRPLKDLLALFSGDPDQLDDKARSWPELLLATITYRHPTMKCNQIKEILDDALSSNKAMMDNGTLDILAQSIMLMDNGAAVNRIYELGNLWLSAHLFDLLEHAGFMERYNLPGIECTQRDNAVLEYALSLVTSEIPFEITADYLAACGTMGMHYLHALIARQPIRTERDAYDLLNICTKFNLDSQKHRIHQLMAKTKLSRGQLGAAVAWSQGALAEDLAHKLLDKLVIPLAKETDVKVLVNLDTVLDTLSTSTMAVKEAQFLKVYSDIVKGWLRKQYDQVTITIAQAMTNEIIPKRFWLILLRDCAFLLQNATNTTISAKHVYDLMSCLDEIELAHNRSELIERFAEYVQREEGNPEDEIARIRLVLVQSLAASVLS